MGCGAQWITLAEAFFFGLQARRGGSTLRCQII
jgi:hypothetical protein